MHVLFADTMLFWMSSNSTFRFLMTMYLYIWLLPMVAVLYTTAQETCLAQSQPYIVKCLSCDLDLEVSCLKLAPYDKLVAVHVFACTAYRRVCTAAT